MPATAEEIMQVYAVLKAQRQPWESTWQAIADTMMPAVNDITTYRQPGNSRTQHIYDTTALDAATLLSGHINGGVTNFQSRWLGLRMAFEPLNELKSTAVWLEGCAKAMHDKLAATTAPASFQEYYRQYPTFGTAALFTDRSQLPTLDGRHGLITRSLPIATYCVGENAEGEVDTLYRELELSPRQAVQEFGIDKVHESVRTKAERAQDRHSPMPYVHAVYPRSDRDPRREGQDDMAFASCYLDVGNKHLCREGGYTRFPFMVSRWEKLRTWSPYGFGPGHIALPETLALNQMDMDMLRALQMYILPPYWTDDPDAAGRVSLLPGMVNPIAKGSQIQSMRAPGNFDVSRIGIDERRRRVRRAFYAEQLEVLPPLDQKQPATAYEIAQRIGFYQRLMGPAFMALLSGLLNPFIDVQFQYMLDDGELPEPPEAVLMAAMQGYGKITVDYLGPLARAQQGDDVTAIDTLFGWAERYAASTGKLDAWHNINIDEAMRVGGRTIGVPPKVLRDAKEVQAIREAEAEAAEEAQQTQTMLEGAKALGPASQMVKALQPAPQEGAA